MIRWKEKVSEINLIYLENICGDDKAFIKKVVETYLSQIPEFLNNIELGLKEQNHELLASSAHKIRSSSQFIGAFSMVDLAQQLESQCRNTMPDSTIQVEELASKILLQFHLMKPELQKVLVG